MSVTELPDPLLRAHLLLLAAMPDPHHPYRCLRRRYEYYMLLHRTMVASNFNFGSHKSLKGRSTAATNRWLPYRG
jgi:hypothetical protein